MGRLCHWLRAGRRSSRSLWYGNRIDTSPSILSWSVSQSLIHGTGNTLAVESNCRSLWIPNRSIHQLRPSQLAPPANWPAIQWKSDGCTTEYPCKGCHRYQYHGVPWVILAFLTSKAKNNDAAGCGGRRWRVAGQPKWKVVVTAVTFSLVAVPGRWKGHDSQAIEFFHRWLVVFFLT